MTFVKSKRSEVKDANPEATFGELGKLLGALWQPNTTEEKAQWLAKAQQDAGSTDNTGDAGDSDAGSESDSEEGGLFTELEETEASDAV